MKISEIFEDEPQQWGFRGDPYLWRELKERLDNVDMPDTPEQLKSIIEKEYEVATGHSIHHREHFTVKKFMHGGMSSGGISPEFWHDCGIPLLVKRHVAP